jgi:hypothetical protein
MDFLSQKNNVESGWDQPADRISFPCEEVLGLPLMPQVYRTGRSLGPLCLTILLEDYHPIASPILKIGKYMATTNPPTIPPRTTIIMGSIIEVRVDTAASTSSS